MRLFFFCVITGFALSCCSCQTTQEPETSFFRDFSLGAIVERMKVSELKPSDDGVGSTTSAGEVTRRRRDFNLIFRIEEQVGTRFDEARFISRLKDEIGRAIGAAGLGVNGGGTSDDDSFHFDYSKGGHEGWLEVMGARVEGNIYKLRGAIRETARKPGQ